MKELHVFFFFHIVLNHISLFIIITNMQARRRERTEERVRAMEEKQRERRQGGKDLESPEAKRLAEYRQQERLRRERDEEERKAKELRDDFRKKAATRAPRAADGWAPENIAVHESSYMLRMVEDAIRRRQSVAKAREEFAKRGAGEKLASYQSRKGRLLIEEVRRVGDAGVDDVPQHNTIVSLLPPSPSSHMMTSLSHQMSNTSCLTPPV